MNEFQVLLLSSLFDLLSDEHADKMLSSYVNYMESHPEMFPVRNWSTDFLIWCRMRTRRLWSTVRAGQGASSALNL